MKILLTNDDGIEAEGLKKLAQKLSATEQIYIAAPAKKLHGASCSITFGTPIKVEEFRLNMGERKSYRILGTPADCVILGLDTLIGDVDLVVSGINDEPNVGDDVRFSGTIGACTEATFSGVRSFGISVEYNGSGGLETAADFSCYLIGFLKKNSIPEGVFLNINVPNTELSKINGVKFVRLGRRRYRDRVHKTISPFNEVFYWIGGRQIEDHEPDTLNAALREDYIAITPMAVDPTSHKFLKEMIDRWKINFPK
jgi:5'-nucleotidase